MFLFTKWGNGDSKESLCPAHIQGEKIMQGPKNQEVESLGAILEAAYHTALLFDSNKKRNKILEKYFMKFAV